MAKKERVVAVDGTASRLLDGDADPCVKDKDAALPALLADGWTVVRTDGAFVVVTKELPDPAHPAEPDDAAVEQPTDGGYRFGGKRGWG